MIAYFQIFGDQVELDGETFDTHSPKATNPNSSLGSCQSSSAKPKQSIDSIANRLRVVHNTSRSTDTNLNVPLRPKLPRTKRGQEAKRKSPRKATRREGKQTRSSTVSRCDVTETCTDRLDISCGDQAIGTERMVAPKAEEISATVMSDVVPDAATEEEPPVINSPKENQEKPCPTVLPRDSSAKHIQGGDMVTHVDEIIHKERRNAVSGDAGSKTALKTNCANATNSEAGSSSRVVKDLPFQLSDLTTEELLTLLYQYPEVTKCGCSLTFTDLAMYYMHRNVHRHGDMLSCGFCDFTASDKHLVLIHQINEHSCKGKNVDGRNSDDSDSRNLQ